MFNRSERLAEIAGAGCMPPALASGWLGDGYERGPPAAARVKQKPIAGGHHRRIPRRRCGLRPRDTQTLVRVVQGT